MEPRVVLGPRHGALHRDVVQQSCTALLALEFSVPKPDLLSYLDREEEVTALDLHVSGDTPTAVWLSLPTEHGAGAGQEEPAEEKPNTDKEHAQLPASRGETQAANTCSSAGTAALARHLQSHLRQKPFDCSQTFTRSCHLEQHLQSHLRQKPFDCSQTFTRSCHLEQHLQSHLRQKPFECSECGKAFTWSSHLERHRRVHTGEKPFECGECGRAFAWSSHLDRHMRTHDTSRVTSRVPSRDEEGVQAAQEPPPAPRNCADCGKSLKQRTDGRRFKHKATQTPLSGTDPAPRPHGCEQCGRCFSSRSGPLEHQGAHGPERLRPCPQRPRRFRCGTAPAKHRRGHRAQGAAKPYPCGTCGKSFGWPSHLERHRRVHTGDKPFRCGECGRGFAVSSHLRRHRRVHTGEKPFPCAHCGQRFGRSSSRKRHQRAHGRRGPARRQVSRDCGTAPGMGAAHRRLHAAGARSPPSLLPPAWWEGEARGGTGTCPEEPSAAEGGSLHSNATAPTEPWVSLPPPSS